MTLIIECTQETVNDSWRPEEEVGETNDKERGAGLEKGFGGFVLAPPNASDKATSTGQHAGGEEAEGDTFHASNITERAA